jgi:hypothetical protein
LLCRYPASATPVAIAIPLADPPPHTSHSTDAPNANTVNDRRSGLQRASEIEIDAADSTAQDMLRDSDSEDDEDEEEEEGDDPWDLEDDGEPARSTFRVPDQN